MKPDKAKAPSSETKERLETLCKAIFLEYEPYTIPRYLEEWHKFFGQWADDKKAPLLIRRSSPLWVVDSADKFKIIFCDNSPAHWAITKAYNESPPRYTRDRAFTYLKTELPLFATLGPGEREEMNLQLREHDLICNHDARKSVLWGTDINLSPKDWRVDHLEDVGVKKNLTNFAILTHDDLKKYFWRLMSPANIILTPKKLAGIGEMNAYLTIAKQHSRRVELLRQLQ